MVEVVWSYVHLLCGEGRSLRLTGDRTYNAELTSVASTVVSRCLCWHQGRAEDP